MKLSRYLFFTLVLFSVFILCGFFASSKVLDVPGARGAGRVVISAPILVVLFGGDRYLAANVEAMRLAATSMDDQGVDGHYLSRAQVEVSKLNACHEDNYYLANALLTWSGVVEIGSEVLRAAVECRTWDYAPPFLYGVNLAFFYKDTDAAVGFLNVAAARSEGNSAGIRKLAIMLQANRLSDEKAALNYLIFQRDNARDEVLRKMLDKRVQRLQGLIYLRDAQRVYERKYGALVSIDQLLRRGIIESLPDDPLRLGYEVKSGRIVLKKMSIAGVEGAL